MNTVLFPVANSCLRQKSMDFSRYPYKKLRLDVSGLSDVNAANDDWWGQDDMTAEEFDMLENQATQSCNQENRALGPACPHNLKTNVYNGNKSLPEAEKKEQLQYELEGRIKLLTQTLEKTSKELREERMHRDKIIAEKNKECEIRESTLHKEIKKMESILQFKDQEIKSVYTKMHVLEAQSVEKRESTSAANEDSNVFLKRFNLGKDSSIQVQSIQEKENHIGYRKHVLTLDMPRGEVKGLDAVSSMLCNRIVIPSVQNFFISSSTSVPSDSPLNNTCHLSAGSVVRLKSEQETCELFEYFEHVFKNHFEYLQNFASKASTVKCVKSSPVSARQKEITYKQHSVISCLKDFTYLLSCPWSATILQNYGAGTKDSSDYQMGPEDISDVENQPSSASNEIINDSEDLPELLKVVLALIDPDTYPSGYCKEVEMEWSFAALFAWSLSSPTVFLKFIDKLPVHNFISSQHSAACLCTSIKFLTNISTHKKFKRILCHKDGHCLVCSIASLLLHLVPTSVLKFSVPMIMIEDFLTAVFTVHCFPDSEVETSQCVSKMLQGVIMSLHTFYKVHEKDELAIVALKKGFTLLYLLSGRISNFKEKRNPVEDKYISLVSGMLTLSKDSSEFKEFYDLIHVLWDFQEDMSEFDFDEPMDEGSPSVSDSEAIE